MFIWRTFIEEFWINVTVENIYFSYHDALKIVIEKNVVEFQISLWNPVKSGNKRKKDMFSRFFSNFNSFIILVKKIIQRKK